MSNDICPQCHISVRKYPDLYHTGGVVTHCHAALMRDNAALRADRDRTVEQNDFYSAEHHAMQDRLAAALDDRDRLAEEVERLERVRTEQAQFCNAMVVERNIFKNAMDASMKTEVRLTAEVAALRDDAERWQTFRKQSESGRRSLKHYTSGPLRGRWSFAPSFTNYEVDVYRTLDEALDAARRAGEGE